MYLIFIIEDGSEEFIPWTQQNPELFGGDIKLTERKNALMSSRARWPTSQIPYVLASNYSIRVIIISANAQRFKCLISQFGNSTQTTRNNCYRDGDLSQPYLYPICPTNN